MKGQGFTKTIYSQSMLNRFLVMEFISFIPEWFLIEKNSTNLLCLLSEEICRPQSCLFCQQLSQLLCKQESYKISAILIRSVGKLNFNVISHSFVDVIGALYVALNQTTCGLHLVSWYVLYFCQMSSSCDPFTKQLFCIIALWNALFNWNYTKYTNSVWGVCQIFIFLLIRCICWCLGWISPTWMTEGNNPLS